MYAGGFKCIAQHNNVHVHGQGLVSTGAAQTVVGKYNDSSTVALFIVGNGSDTSRHNAFAVSQSKITFGNNIFIDSGVYIDGSDGYVRFNDTINISNSDNSALLIHKPTNSIISGLTNTVGSYAADGTTVNSCSNIYIGGYKNTVAHNNSFVHGLNLHTGRSSQALVGQNSVKSSNALFIVGCGSDDVSYNGFEVGLEGGNNGTPYVSILGTKFYAEDIAKLKALLSNDLAGGSY
jgi:hypothetical protein